MLMDNFKLSDLLENRPSSEGCIDESVILTSNEMLSERETDKEGDTETVNEAVSAIVEIENDDSERESTEVIAVVSEQESVIDVDNASSDENTGSNNSSLEKIEELYEHLSEQISAMEALFNKRIMYTNYEEKIIDKMHSELQKYKEDLYSQLVRPILLDVIEVRESITKNAEIYLKKPEGEQSIPNKIFADYAYDLQDILEKNNVEIFKSESGDTFVPVKQSVVKKEYTNDKTLHGKIAESLSSGYSYGDRVISSEKVTVYFYKETEEKQNESEEI